MAVGSQKLPRLWLNQDGDDQSMYQQGNGPNNIFILDTSSRIGEEGFLEMKEIFASMIDEYAKHQDVDENVAVFVCGRQTKFHHYFSNQYEDIKQSLENLEYGGPCPLEAAILLVSRNLRKGSSRSCVINGYHVHPRVILLTNGRPTPSAIKDNDYFPELNDYKDDDAFLSASRELGRIHPIFCIPVGRRPNLTILEFIGGQSRGGKIVYSSEARQLAKYSSNMVQVVMLPVHQTRKQNFVDTEKWKIASMLPFTVSNDGSDRERILTSLVCTFPESEFTEKDQYDIVEICLMKHLYTPMRVIAKELEEEDDLYNERDPRMPPLGSRVNCGRDWELTGQNSHGPGTVVGHSKDAGWLKVKWDRDAHKIRWHRYGSTLSKTDKYEVKVCDEPRILQNQSIATGCLVVRGPDWEWGRQDGGPGNIGSVLKVNDTGVILVRWKNGNMHQYRFGYEGCFDLQICDPFSPECIQHLKDQMQQAALYYPDGDQSAVTEAVVDNALETSSETCDKSKELGETKSCGFKSSPILNVSKGKYFKNDTRHDKTLSDTETDGCTVPAVMKQWLWQDKNGEWILFPRETNEKINMSYHRDPKSTVVAFIDDQAYIAICSKSMDIDFDTSQEIWVQQAEYEANINFDLRYQHGRGPCSIFILDTSASLGKEGFNQMKIAFTTMIDEYSRHSEIDENVAVIVCGWNTRFQRHFSNRYEDIKHCLDDVKLGGPSPLTAAFFLAQGSMNNQASHACTMGYFHIHTKIICITDGRPTDFTMTSSCDDYPQMETEQDTDHLLQLTRKIGRVNPIHCIPVGRNPDTTTLEFICAQSKGGKIVYPEHAKQFAKYSQNMKTASELSYTLLNDGTDREGILVCLAGTFPDRDFTEMDQADIVEIYTKKHLYRPIEELAEDVIREHERDLTMLPVGSRVRRGRDWEWGNQDNFGAGTVVNHLPPGWLAVQWDSGSKYNYRYGSGPDFTDKYDLEVCEEPRTLRNELIAVGSLVKRGVDWNYSDQDGGPGNMGSVFNARRNGLVQVRWQNGIEQTYSFGHNGRYDLIICDPFSPEAEAFLKDQRRNAAVYPSFGSKSEEFHTHRHHKTDCDVMSTVKEHSKPLLRVTKGKYFKNKVTEHSKSDLETDGLAFPIAVNQWFWKDDEGKWNPYPREINERINKCFKRNPRSTVVVTIQNQSIVMAKHIQINLTTREMTDVKLVKDDSTDSLN